MNVPWLGQESSLSPLIAEKVYQLATAYCRLQTWYTNRSERRRKRQFDHWAELPYNSKRIELAREMRCEPNSYRIDDVLSK
jgi:hypothetical protein